jgi:CDP-paratose 2-epimerase
MSVAIITGSCGLVGSASAEHFSNTHQVIGIDNDMRAEYFGSYASTSAAQIRLESIKTYKHEFVDIRNFQELARIFRHYGSDISLVIHAAAQPSHDWAGKYPAIDFTTNAVATSTLLELTRVFCPEAVFIFLSTNKVYGDTTNSLPLVECETRWEISVNHEYWQGISESMSVDQSLHSLFGASKLAADVLVQEYGRYFGMKTVCFRCGCLTGPAHAGAKQHGFLAYLTRCLREGIPYTIYGYSGKQVRDNLHSSDLVRAFDAFYRNPTAGEVFNLGGGRMSNCSVREAIVMCENLLGRKLETQTGPARSGDHIWWVTNSRKFRAAYGWEPRYTSKRILEEMLSPVRA